MPIKCHIFNRFKWLYESCSCYIKKYNIFQYYSVLLMFMFCNIHNAGNALCVANVLFASLFKLYLFWYCACLSCTFFNLCGWLYVGQCRLDSSTGPPFIQSLISGEELDQALVMKALHYLK